MAIHMAAFGGSVACLRLLLDAGIEVNTRDMADETPLHKAAAFGMIECLRELVYSRGADLEATNVHGEMPLDLAQEVHQLDSVFVLLNASAKRAASLKSG
jgi:ankyrin repeat protein